MRCVTLASLLFCAFVMAQPGSSAERPVEDFTHAVIGEEFTATWCVYCPSAADNLNKVWQPKSEYPDDPYYHDQFFFMALITDVNDKAGDRAGDYPDFTGYPTVYFDGGDEKVEGGQSDTSNYEQAIDNCGGRTDTDISLRISMQHLGNDQIAVQAYITWNGDAGFGDPTFDGYIRAYIVEPVSRYDNYDGEPYHFGFLDYAFDQEVELDPHEEVVLETVWIGGEHSGDADGDGDCGDETDCEDFSDISYDNLNIFVSFFNKEQTSADDYALQTAFAIPPQVSFEFPTDNLSDTASLPGSASQPRSAIATVEYSVDGGEWILVDGTAEFNLMLDTTAYESGQHELVLRVSDAGGTTVELAGNIEILNDSEPPEVSWLAPEAETDVSGLVVLAASASDNGGGATVEWHLGDGEWRQMQHVTDQRWEAEWNTEEAGVENGDYALEVRATDEYGHTATASRALTVANSGEVTYPAIDLDGVHALPVAGDFTVTVTAEDPEGIASLEYRIDAGIWKSISDGSFDIDVIALSDGVHALDVWAIDNVGTNAWNNVSFECDATAPLVALGAVPEIVTALVQIDFTVSDYSELGSLRYRVDSGDWQPLEPDDTSLEWDSTTVVDDRDYVLELEAVDVLGNLASDWVTFEVKNSAYLFPVSGAKAGAPIEVRAYVDYPDPVAVYLLVAGQRLSMQAGPAGWSTEVTMAEAGQYPCRIEVDTGHGSFQSEEQMLNIGKAAPIQESSDGNDLQLPGPGILVALAALGFVARRRH